MIDPPLQRHQAAQVRVEYRITRDLPDVEISAVVTVTIRAGIHFVFTVFMEQLRAAIDRHQPRVFEVVILHRTGALVEKRIAAHGLGLGNARARHPHQAVQNPPPHCSDTR